MKISDIVSYLVRVLPFYTDFFSEDLIVKEITSTGLEAVVEFEEEHGLRDNSIISIMNTLVPNVLIDFYETADHIRFTTERNHDLTLNYHKTVSLHGFNQVLLNGEHALIEVPNRKQFIIEKPDGFILDFSGSPELLENLNIFGYNGSFSVMVIDDFKVKFPLVKTIGSPAYLLFGKVICRGKARIYGGEADDRMLAAYTKQNNSKFILFVVLDNVTASASDVEYSSAVVSPDAYKTIFGARIIDTFSIFVFVPNNSNISVRKAIDYRDDILEVLVVTMLNRRFPSPFNMKETDYCTLKEAAMQRLELPFVVHSFVFEIMSTLNIEDVYNQDTSVAFRDVNGEIGNNISDESLELLVNLDDIPYN